MVLDQQPDLCTPCRTPTAGQIESYTIESGGFQTQALTWQTAINNNAQWAIILTWNDHYEGHALRPNATAQYSFYDLTAYYISWFKTGVQPTIVRDVLYYSHRMHLSESRSEL